MAFLDEHFLLRNKTAQLLYHDYVKGMPIIDYHCHLSPWQIADDIRFPNLAQAWLSGDHYKWRAMRANGVSEAYCTGEMPDEEKFQKWAETVPYTMRNPLYHWTHLELQRYFGIYDTLGPLNAQMIYEQCSASLSTPEYSVRNLLRKMRVRLVCTTDDPVDSLEHHRKIKDDGFEIAIVPAFRADRVLDTGDPQRILEYLKKLMEASGFEVSSFEGLLQALKSRHDFFAANGCSVADHGLEELFADGYSDHEIESIFKKILAARPLSDEEQRKFKSAVLYHLCAWNHEKGWVQQFHLGALRNNNSRILRNFGRDSGHDSIGDFSQARTLSKFLDRLDRENKLAKTILYNLNPADNEVFATMAGNFNDGAEPGKIQWGSAWWFLDQKDGMTRQLNVLSNMGLLSRFVGMLTDSRSFLSFPRHEYFRRIVCDLFGEDIENGELPNDINWIGKILKDICYHNAANYFNWQDQLSLARDSKLS